MTKIKDEVKSENSSSATKQDLAALELKLSERIGETRTEMIKWMFIFWIGQVAVTFGFILLFLKK